MISGIPPSSANFTSPPDTAVTCGAWASEREAEDALVTFLLRSGLFHVYRQVAGRPLWTHCFQRTQDVRADVLLLPSAQLLRHGWTAGAIVVEVKRSGEKIGPACSQLVDYLNSLWWLPGTGGVGVVPAFGFLFPAHKQHGPLASVMAHQHIGTAVFRRDWLHCFCGEHRVLSIGPAGEVRPGLTRFGQKTGSR